MSNDLTMYVPPTADQIDVLKNSVCVGLRPAELQLFLLSCERLQLDPFAKEIYCYVKEWKGQRKLQIEMTIQGARQLAERSGEYDGQDEPDFDCEPDGRLRHPNWCRVTVYRRKGERRVPTPVRLFWSEWYQSTPVWDSKPWHMLSVRAEFHALKKAFPRQLAGVTPGGGGDEEIPQRAGAAPLVALPPMEYGEPPPIGEPPEALVPKWHQALAAFGGLGVLGEDILGRLQIKSAAELAEPHFLALSAWYRELTKPRE